MRRVMIIAIGGCMLLAVAACGGGSAATRSAANTGKNTAFTMGQFPGPFIMQAALDDNAFKNIDLKVTDLQSGPASLPLMVHGTLAGADGLSEPPVIIALNNDVPIKVVWATNSSPHYLLVRPGITSASQIRGKKIAAPAGSILQIQLEQFLAAHGMTINDIQYVNLTPQAIVSAYKTGAIDGGYLWQPYATTLQKDGATILDTSAGHSLDVFSAAFVQKNPQIVQRFVCDLAATQTAFLANPQATWTDLANKLDLDASTLPNLLPQSAVYAPPDVASTVLSPNGQLVQEINGIAQAMSQLKQITSVPTAAQAQSLIDPTFAEAVAAGKCSSS